MEIIWYVNLKRDRHWHGIMTRRDESRRGLGGCSSVENLSILIRLLRLHRIDSVCLFFVGADDSLGTHSVIIIGGV